MGNIQKIKMCEEIIDLFKKRGNFKNMSIFYTSRQQIIVLCKRNVKFSFFIFYIGLQLQLKKIKWID